MDKNNMGYTLVELMVSMLLTAIVISIVIAFIATNSDSYRYASERMELQMDAQAVSNQICDMVLEADWIKSVDIGSDSKGIIIWHNSITDMLLFIKSEKKLYLLEKLTKDQLSDLSHQTFSQDDDLMAGNLSDIAYSPMDEGDMVNRQQINLILTFTKGSQSITVERNIKFRNRLKSPE